MFIFLKIQQYVIFHFFEIMFWVFLLFKTLVTII